MKNYKTTNEVVEEHEPVGVELEYTDRIDLVLFDIYWVANDYDTNIRCIYLYDHENFYENIIQKHF